MKNLYSASAHEQHSELSLCIYVLEEETRNLSNKFVNEKCEIKSFSYLLEHRRLVKELKLLRLEMIKFESEHPEFRTVS